MYVELNGISVDRTYLDTLTEQYLESLGAIEAELDQIIAGPNQAGRDYDKAGGLNPRSPKQVTEYLADKGIIVDSTNEETLKYLQERLVARNEDDGEVFKFTEVLLKHRREAKLYGTYVKGVRKRLYGGRVFPTILLHGTTSGRPACRNPNLFNVPRESAIRRLYVPSKPENVYLQSDYAQAELRVLCFLAGDTYFRDIFNEGVRDVFDELTPILYPELPSKEETPPELWKEMRIRVKAFVYGLSYGREAYSIAMEFKLPTREAERMRDNFFSVIPEIVEWRKQIRQSVLDGEDLVTPLGRHRRFMLITPENRKDVMNEALAFMPQSTASDICLQAFIWSRRDLKGIGYIRNTVYDSILAECHEDRVEEVQGILERNMLKASELVVGDYVKFKVDTKVGRSWGEV
jgi:DNA polymerase-1